MAETTSNGNFDDQLEMYVPTLSQVKASDYSTTSTDQLGAVFAQTEETSDNPDVSNDQVFVDQLSQLNTDQLDNFTETLKGVNEGLSLSQTKSGFTTETPNEQNLW